MAKKTNCERNGIKYFRRYATINGKRKMVYGESERDWQTKVDEMKKMENFGIIETKDSVGKAIDQWVYTVMLGRHNVRKSTTAIYEGIYRNSILGHRIMSLPLSEVKSAHIQGYINEMVENGKTANSIRESVKVLNMFFKYAVSEGFLLKNPCSTVSVPSMPKPEPIEVFSDDEVKRILSHVNMSHYEFVYILAFATGMRMGELLGLRYEDIQDGFVKVNKALSVSRTPKKQGDEVVVEYAVIDAEPKTDSSYRTIPISDQVMKELEAHKSRSQLHRLKLGKGKIKESDRIFISPMGLPCRSAQVVTDWQMILVAAEVPYKTFHSTRHTYITKLVQSGMNLVAVMQLAGHSKLSTTMRYTHIEMENKQISTDIMDKVLFE